MADEAHSAAHPAAGLSENERIEYLIAVAALVYADHHVDESEMQVLRALAAILELPPGAYTLVMASARFPDPGRVERILVKFQKQTIRFTLLCDAVLVAFADGRLAPGETMVIARFARALGITMTQAGKIGQYVADAHAEHHPLAQELIAGLDEASAHVHPPRGLRALYRKLVGVKAK